MPDTFPAQDRAPGAAAVQGIEAAGDTRMLAEQIAVLESGMGVAAREGWGVILLRGPQAAQFLAGITTNHVTALPLGGFQHQLICANKGKILFEAGLIRTKPEEFLLLTAPGKQEAVAGHLEFYHVREEFQMGQAGLARVDLLGAGLQETMRALGRLEHAPDGKFEGAPLVTVPDPWRGLPRVIALLPAGRVEAFVMHLIGSGAQPIGEDALEEARIWAGVPRMDVDFGQDFLPAEAALYTHIAFNKGCYVGQEIHARMHHRGHPNRKLTAIELPGAEAAASGGELFQAGEAVGRITSLARLGRGGRRRGIALVRFATIQAVMQSTAALALRPEAAAAVNLIPLATDLGVARP